MALVNPSSPPLPQNYNGPYYMGWSAISEAFAAKIRGLKIFAKVHPNLKFIKENAQTRKWRDEFCEDAKTEGGPRIVNAVMLNREGFPVTKISQDNSIWFSRQSTVELYLYYEFENWEVWNPMLEQLMNALGHGDRTLGQACLSYELPAGGQSMRADFGGVDCHHTMISLRVEEAGKLQL